MYYVQVKSQKKVCHTNFNMKKTEVTTLIDKMTSE